MSRPEPPILFFDARCLLCHRAVRWIIRRDPERRFSFAALDSTTAGELIAADHPLRRADTVILWDGADLRGHSEAVFRTLARLRTPWKWLRIFAVLPRRLTDPVYRLIARRRYGWFGTDETCALPDPAEKSRFLP